MIIEVTQLNEEQLREVVARYPFQRLRLITKLSKLAIEHLHTIQHCSAEKVAQTIILAESIYQSAGSDENDPTLQYLTWHYLNNILCITQAASTDLRFILEHAFRDINR